MSSFKIERTLAIIKPCAVHLRFSILRQIQSVGLQVLKECCVKLSIAQVERFFQYKTKGENIDEWISGPLIAFCLSHNDAIELWKKLMGPENRQIAKESAPTSIRGMYEYDVNNPVYGSESSDDAQHELQFFFPSIQPEIFPSSTDEINEFLCNEIYHSLFNALFEFLKIKPDDPIKWIAEYMLEHNTNQPSILHNTCPDAINMLQQLKKEEQEKMERNRQMMSAIAKCGCSSISSVSSLSSF